MVGLANEYPESFNLPFTSEEDMVELYIVRINHINTSSFGVYKLPILF
jgi:hypothetical protein